MSEHFEPCVQFVERGKACLRVTSDGDVYELKSVLGRGAFAEVLLAYRHVNGAATTPVAMKCYSLSRLTRQRRLVQRFQHGGGKKAGAETGLNKVAREVSLLRTLGPHPNIASLRRALIDEGGDAVFVVIDYVDAGEIMVVQPEVVGKKRERASIAPPPDVTRSPTFCDDGENGDTCESRSSSAADSDVESDTRPQRLFVSRLTGGPLPLAAARAAIRDLLNALSHAHALGIAHRDVKPENALMSHDGLLKLADWGAAQHFDGDTLADAGRGVTTNDSSCATPPSPIAAAVVADSAASTCPVHCAEKARPKSLRPAWVANTVGTFLFLPSEAVGDNRGLRLGDPGDSGTVQQQHVLQRDAGGDAAADNSEVPAVLAVPPQLDSCTCCPALPVDGSYDAFAADVWAAGVTAHVLLFGVLPFGIGRATSLVEAMELISQGSALCPLPLQRAYSPDELGRDKDTLQSLEQLLGALLDRSPLTRATAAEALDLPFLNGFADADSAPSLRYPAIDESSLPRYTPAQVISAEIQPEEDEGGLVLQHEEEAQHQHVDARGGNTVLQNNGDATPSSGRGRRAWSIMSRFIGALSRLFLRKGRQA